MNGVKNIDGGVTAPQGFKANGIHCGIRKNKSKKDLSLIFADNECAAAAVYTTNVVKGAPVAVTKRHLENGTARAVICNSGIANTCSSGGEEVAEETCRSVAKALNISEDDVIVASTGVIGVPLDVEVIKAGIPELVSGLSQDGGLSAVQGIMTTDTRPKQHAVEFELNGKTCRIGGMAKGSGMIHPNMATMLSFLTTDAAISHEMLAESLRECVGVSYNMVSIDGDTSTNDMTSIMASGLAGNCRITEKNEDYAAFTAALRTICIQLAREIAADGEGATKLVICRLKGADCVSDARTAAKSVIRSPLVKTAMFGADANWGRVMCAVGYSGISFDPDRVNVSFASEAGSVEVCRNGREVEFSEDEARKVLSCGEVEIDVDLNQGTSEATAFGCDLTYEYVKINGEYRT